MKKTLAAAALVLGATLGLSACTQADRAAQNVSTAAENFQVTRRLVVINTVTDKPQFEMVGRFSIDVDEVENQLEVTAKQEDGSFKKHFVGLTPTVTYVVEDVSGADVSAYRYQISFLPEAIVPVEVVNGSGK